ncbi:uncharacterized protein LOC125488552 isoform X1 [Plutella xylostella]|uniref:uncharacterized protein LOC125488552 isoform X1 n=1 Tax=Plutella xylostella TaxID=51655 RepID=UPI00203278C7|nr:uncharacterized protein LOC125488552 isoform X1 [Plutella xylostella]
MYDLNKDAVYFLPHRAVINENSKTTPVRTVFDASMLTNKKISLNDLQLNGPTVQRDLYDIIILFRLGKFTFTTDIRRMFRNINVDPAYTSLQNILWRESPTETLKVIRLDSVTYGLKSSSYLATRCLDELATRYRNDYPLASSIIKENTYVDDIIYSHNDLNTILSAKDQLCNLLKLGSFHTHKWSTNDERILAGVPSTERQFESLNLQKDDYNMKALGLQLNINDDKFIISSPEPFNPEKITKRTILSYIGRIYDPMGYVGPIVVTAKAIMQRLWSSSCSWNDSPPQDVQKEWLQYTERLAKIQPITLARNIDFSDSHTAQLIGFADASSTTGYGCCLYLRLIDASGTKVTTHLLSSKSRINPVQKKNMTVPRLELNAALLLSKLVVKTYATLQLKIEIKNVYLFSDSQVVLAWLKTEITKLQAYVANRVNVIHQNTSRWRWLYVNTHENPADLISRGVQPGELNGNNLWWRGPEFLQNSKWDLSCNEPKIPQEVPEVRSCAVLASAPVCIKPNPLEYVFKRLYECSDINKIVRLYAYILRFLNNTNKINNKLNTSYLTSSELHNSLLQIIKYEQSQYFSAEIECLSKGKKLTGNLTNLHPFLDEMGLLRLSGRLHHAKIAYSHKHPVILPKGSLITTLLIRSEHQRLMHAGSRLVLANLNQKFWIVNGLLEVKKIVHKCVTCFRHKATVAKQLMGSLPAGRVNKPSRPFEIIGVDFCGPLEIKLSRIRRSVIGKGYILVCVCFATKAIHLELASDLTTETFLACFRRLISRRGLPTEVHCDNASTFKCANSQLVELYSLQSSQRHRAQVYEFASQRGIDFHFIPSYSATFGGIWESAVKSTKHHLKRVLQKNVLTYEQMNTVLTEIECILNSRPLLPLSTEPDDFCYLTPGHFITGSALTMYPEKNVSDIPQNRLKFWQLCTSLKQKFRNTWHKYYLNILQNRPKWRQEQHNVKLGSLVILKEDNIPNMCWPMARIVKLFPGHDGKVRAVEVRTPNHKTHHRSIHKICILPIEDNN